MFQLIEMSAILLCNIFPVQSFLGCMPKKYSAGDTTLSMEHMQIYFSKNNNILLYKTFRE